MCVLMSSCAGSITLSRLSCLGAMKLIAISRFITVRLNIDVRFLF